MKLKPIPLPTELSVEAYKEWIRVDLHTWFMDRTPMTLNQKADTLRKKLNKAVRGYSARAVIELLKEERRKGPITVTSHKGSDPFNLDALIGFLREVHRPREFDHESLAWLETELIKIFDELKDQETWPHYIMQPWALRSTVTYALRYFKLGDVESWKHIALGTSTTKKNDPSDPSVDAFLALAKRRGKQKPDDQLMSQLLAKTCIFLGVCLNSTEESDIDSAKTWFENDKLNSKWMCPRLRRWFNGMKRYFTMTTYDETWATKLKVALQLT